MSTKAIREALKNLRTDGAGRPDLADAAEKELEAIEKAAHLVTVVGQSEANAGRYDEWKAACEFLRSIAKGAP